MDFNNFLKPRRTNEKIRLRFGRRKSRGDNLRITSITAGIEAPCFSITIRQRASALNVRREGSALPTHAAAPIPGFVFIVIVIFTRDY